MLWDNAKKFALIPDAVVAPHGVSTKAPAAREGLAAYQLVGGVTAYQGDDGELE